MPKNMNNIKKPIITKINHASGTFETPDPFIFCVHHRDNFPSGDSKMRAPRRGNGHDFDPNAEYRMYHGDRVPGFPQHPHRGFETLSASMQGLVDHTDSMGYAGRYGNGDLQWMTAGSGVVHGENFPLINEDKRNPMHFFQIWLNLPKKSKMCKPGFVMHWKEEIPIVKSKDNKTEITVWAGEVGGKKGLAPPPDSYASDPKSEIAVLLLRMKPSAEYTLPGAKGGDEVNRAVYFVEGGSVNIAKEKEITRKSHVTVRAGESLYIKNTHRSQDALLLLLQGKPLNEPVAKYGPFVMNTEEELQQAFSDYRRTKFGGWPWPKDAMIFPREKGRFALIDGKEIYPPSLSSSPSSKTCEKNENKE